MKACVLNSITFSLISFHLKVNLENYCVAREAIKRHRKNAVCVPDTKARIEKPSHNVEYSPLCKIILIFSILFSTIRFNSKLQSFNG
jgi:hypothetical protein